MAEIKSEIRRLRESAELTQTELAEKLGVTQGFIASLESGRKTSFNVETLYALSDVFGVSADHWRPFLVSHHGAAKRPSGPPAKSKKAPKPK